MDVVTTAKAARTLGVTVRRVQALIEAGKLPAVKQGRDWLIDRRDLEALRKRRERARKKGRE